MLCAEFELNFQAYIEIFNITLIAALHMSVTSLIKAWELKMCLNNQW